MKYIIVIAICLAIVFGTIIAFKNNPPMWTWEVEEYKVKRGDTYWSIGKSLGLEGQDLLEWINKVESINPYNPNDLHKGDIVDILIPPED